MRNLFLPIFIRESMLMCQRALIICSSHPSVFILKLVIEKQTDIYLGKVCVPFDPLQVDHFDVNRVPTLNNVINDLSSGA